MKRCLTILMLLLPCLWVHAQDNLLWYKQPAAKWTDALPIGNGFMGAMIYGGVEAEHLQFNEATLWTGKPRAYARKGAVQYLDTIRTLLQQGKQKEAEELAGNHFMGLKNVEDSVYARNKQQWLQQVNTHAKPVAVAFDDSAWPQMELPVNNGWETAGLEGVDGELWFRNSFEVSDEWIDKELTIDLGRIRDEDYTYINGVLIGHAEGISKKRSYTIPAGVLKKGKNVIAVQVLNYYDKGGFIGIKENRKILAIYAKGSVPESGIMLTAMWRYKIYDNNPPEFPQYQAAYQPFGDVYVRFVNNQPVSNYTRSLNIGNAIAGVSYTQGNVQYKREYFASNPHKAIVARYTASERASINTVIRFGTAHSEYSIRAIDQHTLMLYVQVKNGALHGVSYLRVNNQGGRVAVQGDSLIVSKADTLTLYLTAATSYISYKNVSGNAEKLAYKALQALRPFGYEQLKAVHIKDYQQQYNTFALDLGKPSTLPTDERILHFDVQKDPSLIALYMQYGRYLLIACSRKGGQPANLQGIWNNQLTPSWGSKYTTNINLEMNYWPADVLNLSGNAQPLFDMLPQLRDAGTITAKEHYGIHDGWVLHHNTDLWRGTAPINASNHGVWVTGGAWLCQHIWDHFLFSRDTAFLRKYYPIMQASAKFHMQHLVKDPASGKLISTPSNSPEHGGLVAGPSMDHQIIRELLKHTAAAASILYPKDIQWINSLQQTANNIAPNTIGKYGQLQEWLQDVDDTTDTHRHVSHLWAVYPSTDITWQDSALMKAARQSLLYRGDDGTGWSLAWKLNLWARFKEGNHALLILQKLLSAADATAGNASERGGVYRNLFDAHPPFQIDGNFGGAAGIAEMLVQSHMDYIELLPALPDALAKGSVKGIVARGGFELSFQWKDKQLQQISILSKAGGDCILRYGNKQVTIKTIKGKTYQLTNSLQLL